MTLRTIRLELARTREAPDGSAHCGYEIHAPLTADGHFDAEAWKKVKRACSVRRFWEGEDDEQGILVHRGGHRWLISYAEGDADDEPIFRFDRHVFQEGEYVSITEHDGVTRPFKVIAVR